MTCHAQIYRTLGPSCAVTTMRCTRYIVPFQIHVPLAIVKIYSCHKEREEKETTTAAPPTMNPIDIAVSRVLKDQVVRAALKTAVPWIDDQDNLRAVRRDRWDGMIFVVVLLVLHHIRGARVPPAVYDSDHRLCFPLCSQPRVEGDRPTKILVYGLSAEMIGHLQRASPLNSGPPAC
jgi:hypothetical protein